MRQASKRDRSRVGLMTGVLVAGALVALPAAPAQAAPIVKQIDAGRLNSSCALTATAVKCWGRGGAGALGNGSRNSINKPKTVKRVGKGVRQIDIGTGQACAVSRASRVWCWGRNRQGQLGQGNLMDTYLLPVMVKKIGKVRQVAAGNDFTCATLQSRRVACWGINSHGQLGDGSQKTRTLPVMVKGLKNVKLLSAGGYSACALTMANAVKCWGSNQTGQIGDGTFKMRKTPVQVSGLTSGVRWVSAGWKHSCAVLDTGAAKCWGDNGKGQLGNGNTTIKRKPTQVSGLGAGSGTLIISAGTGYTCARVNSGAKCWGSNTTGQLGDGTTDDQITPVDVVGLTTGVRFVSAGWQQSCAVMAGGKPTKCWGDNFYGELGNGTWVDSTTAVNVVWS